MFLTRRELNAHGSFLTRRETFYIYIIWLLGLTFWLIRQYFFNTQGLRGKSDASNLLEEL